MTKDQPDNSITNGDSPPELDKYFNLAVKTQASDIHLKMGQPPKLRIQGELKNTTGEIMTEKRL